MQSTFLLFWLVVRTTLSFQFHRLEYDDDYRMANGLGGRIRPNLNKFNSPRNFPQPNVHSSKRSREFNPNPFMAMLMHKRSEPAATQGFLKIQKAPPKLLEARQNGVTTLECSASGNPAPRITWYKDGLPLIKEYDKLLTEGDYGEFNIQSLSETRSQITLDCVSQRDAGMYQCVAHTDQKKTSVETEVQVVSFEPNGCVPQKMMDFTSSPPKIFQWMETYMQMIGTDARLICRAGGHHSTSWIGPDEKDIEPNEKFDLMKNGDLFIKKLSFHDMGLYRCLVKNDFGEDLKDTFLYPMAPNDSE